MLDVKKMLTKISDKFKTEKGNLAMTVTTGTLSSCAYADTHQTVADVRRIENIIYSDKGDCLRSLWRLLLRAVWAAHPLTSWLKRSDRKLGECGVQSAEWNQTNEQSVLGRNEWRHHGSGLCGSYRRRQSERSSVKSLLRSRCVLASVALSEGGCF